MTSTAPSPSIPDQPIRSTVRFGLSDVISEPSPYTARPRPKARSRPRMSPSFAPTSMNAAITSVYIVIALCTPVTVVFRSATICEIETFMTLESSTMMNWADARMISGSHLRTRPTLRWPPEEPADGKSRPAPIDELLRVGSSGADGGSDPRRGLRRARTGDHALRRARRGRRRHADRLQRRVRLRLREARRPVRPHGARRGQALLRGLRAAG